MAPLAWRRAPLASRQKCLVAASATALWRGVPRTPLRRDQ